jgi:hypothetical protein
VDGTGILSAETFYTGDRAVMRDIVDALDRLASVRRLHPETRRARDRLAIMIRESMPVVAVHGMSPKALATLAGCREANIHKMCSRGTLKSELVGGRRVIDPDAAEQYVRRRQQAETNRS